MLQGQKKITNNSENFRMMSNMEKLVIIYWRGGRATKPTPIKGSKKLTLQKLKLKNRQSLTTCA